MPSERVFQRIAQVIYKRFRWDRKYFIDEISYCFRCQLFWTIVLLTKRTWMSHPNTTTKRAALWQWWHNPTVELAQVKWRHQSRRNKLSPMRLNLLEQTSKGKLQHADFYPSMWYEFRNKKSVERDIQEKKKKSVNKHNLAERSHPIVLQCRKCNSPPGLSTAQSRTASSHWRDGSCDNKPSNAEAATLLQTKTRDRQAMPCNIKFFQRKTILLENVWFVPGSCFKYWCNEELMQWKEGGRVLPIVTRTTLPWTPFGRLFLLCTRVELGILAKPLQIPGKNRNVTKAMLSLPTYGKAPAQILQTT